MRTINLKVRYIGSTEKMGTLFFKLKIVQKVILEIIRTTESIYNVLSGFSSECVRQTY